MGYETDYNLDIVCHPCDVDTFDIIEEASKLTYGLDENGDTYEGCKWYDHEKDMKEFSKKYPEVTFELRGVGEEFPDAWKKYFKNGLMQVCTANVTYEKYDIAKLI